MLTKIWRSLFTDVTKFENRNKNISISVLACSEPEKKDQKPVIWPKMIPKDVKNDHFKLLLVRYEEFHHFCLISNFDKVMGIHSA